MGFLGRILETKREEVARLRVAQDRLRDAADAAPSVRDFAARLRPPRPGDPPRVIAEIKFRSPSKGPLRPRCDPAWLGERYEAGGAAAISVLCDAPFFDGSFADLEQVRARVGVPVLCKEFVVDEVQVDAARAAGADAVLLIVRILDPGRLADLATAVRRRGMTPLFEVNGPDELSAALACDPTVVGVNSRDLDTFNVIPHVFDDVLPDIPRGVVAVAMSGVSSIRDLAALRDGGADAVLVGEHLMRATDPGAALAALL
jgi:indole-3-glycerol phosphate synthase